VCARERERGGGGRGGEVGRKEGEEGGGVRLTVSFPFDPMSTISNISNRIPTALALIFSSVSILETFSHTSFSSSIPSLRSSMEVIIIPIKRDIRTITPNTINIIKYRAATQPNAYDFSQFDSKEGYK
jgi:hypothetical protein